MTPSHPGAIAVVQLTGSVADILKRLTGRDHWPIGRLRLVRFADIDEGLAAVISPNVAQLMPHGGPRVVQRLTRHLIQLGASPIEPGDVLPRELYPEATDEIEAIMLAALARAASPAAIDLLRAQPPIWRARPAITSDVINRSQRLNRLIDPPLVVVAGPPNVGKSTLSNALLGRSMSIAIDLPGTTRDYTAARIELGGLVVQWHDTPGMRVSDDPIEAKAIELARRLMCRADLLLAMTDVEHDWPVLPRPADMLLGSKADAAVRQDADVSVSALTGQGIADLVVAARDLLVPPADREAARTTLWLFDERLRATV
jgi:tRNA modification GTPase